MDNKDINNIPICFSPPEAAPFFKSGSCYDSEQIPEFRKSVGGANFTIEYNRQYETCDSNVLFSPEVLAACPRSELTMDEIQAQMAAKLMDEVINRMDEQIWEGYLEGRRYDIYEKVEMNVMPAGYEISQETRRELAAEYQGMIREERLRKQEESAANFAAKSEGVVIDVEEIDVEIIDIQTIVVGYQPEYDKEEYRIKYVGDDKEVCMEIAQECLVLMNELTERLGGKIVGDKVEWDDEW